MGQEIAGNPDQEDQLLSNRIKAHTKPAHQQLEKIVVSKLRQIRNNTDYAQLLAYFYAYFSEVESAIAPFIDETILPDHLQRRKADRLKADIDQLGGAADLPRPAAITIKTPAAAMGAMYVMEGSVMGGPIIINMLQKSGISTGFRFFSGYSNQTGEMWARFITALNAIPEDNTRQAIEAADRVFSGFAAYFADNDLTIG